MTNQFDETSFLTGGNAVFIAELYARYVEDPSSVDASWVQFFTELRDEGAAIAQDFKGTAGAKRDLKIIGAVDPEAAAAAAAAAKKGGKDAKAAPAVDPAASRQAVLDSIRALMMIRTYRVRGHFEGDPQKYRDQAEVLTWQEKNDPVARFEQLLIKDQILTKKKTKTVWDEVKAELDAAIEFARNSPFPKPEDALQDLYVNA